VRGRRRAVFDRNDAPRRERYFAGNQINDSVRDLVRFHRGNLLDPALLANEKFDVVFCKNLLIYFTEDARGHAVAQLQRWLAPAGRLFAGASEMAWLQSAGGFTGAGGSAAMALKKKNAGRASARLSRSRVRTKAVPKFAIPTLSDARSLAGIGKLPEAAEVAQAWLRLHGPSDEAFVILGLVAFARRKDAEGRALMERALYLNPDNVEALTFLALERERDGDAANAALLRERARRAETSHA
jgi:chemotaxis protein methyltransferase WspC